MSVQAVLLAAGAGTRFGGDKLLAPLRSAPALGVAALRNLKAAGLPVVAVVRPEDVRLATMLQAESARVVVCENAKLGMAHSLACAIRASSDASGWLVALADMPRVRPATIAAIAAGLRDGSAIVIPVHGGERGNPVAIGAAYRDELLELTGDVGARALFQRHAARLVRLEVDDPGVLADVDTRDDLTEFAD
jgi:molybdenum cofactor cytidylyltransferase